MNSIALYGVQALLGITACAAGIAKLAGADVMVDSLAMIGLGHGFRVMAGSIELVAGLVLLVPRAGVVGAGLLVCVMVGTIGMTVGHVAARQGGPLPAHSAPLAGYATVETRMGSRDDRAVEPGWRGVPLAISKSSLDI